MERAMPWIFLLDTKGWASVLSSTAAFEGRCLGNCLSKKKKKIICFRKLAWMTAWESSSWGCFLSGFNYDADQQLCWNWTSPLSYEPSWSGIPTHWRITMKLLILQFYRCLFCVPYPNLATGLDVKNMGLQKIWIQVFWFILIQKLSDLIVPATLTKNEGMGLD